MGYHHVPVRPGLLVEATALPDRERLRHVDLDVLDVLPVPDGFEQTIGEPERQDGLRRLLPEEVIDTEHLILAERAVHDPVEVPGARQVGAERLFHDDPGPIDQVRLAQGRHDRDGSGRRHAQVVQSPGLASEDVLGAGDRVGQAHGTGRPAT